VASTLRENATRIAGKRKKQVVTVDAALTTTSEQSQLSVITYSKRKLITSEKETALQHSGCCCGRPTRVNNKFKTAAPTRDDETTARANIITHTNRLRLQVHGQLSKPARNNG